MQRSGEHFEAVDCCAYLVSWSSEASWTDRSLLSHMQSDTKDSNFLFNKSDIFMPSLKWASPGKMDSVDW